MKRLLTADAARVFGDPTAFVRADGSVGPEWERAILAWARLPAPLPLSWLPEKKVIRFLCHALLVGHFERALKGAYAVQEAWGTVNDFGGCYAWRPNRRDRSVLSLHSWGIAIDLDVCDNPQGREPKVHPSVVAAFEAEGFLWGGRFTGRSRDGMHFEFADVARL